MRQVIVELSCIAALSFSVTGCSSGSDAAAHTERVAAPKSASVDASVPADEQEQPMRVLVTGFNDWKELGEPANVWRCRDNPSCRLLVGAELEASPTVFEGPLPARLRERAPAIEWRFATMPVTWEVFAAVPRDVDLIVNLGLGVYDRLDALQLEAGAYNLRRGADAEGREASDSIDPEAPAVLEPPTDSPIRGRLDGLVGQHIAGYEITVVEAREDNSYLCNETHYRALTAVHEHSGRLREAYFLHIPYAREGDYDALAEGVAGVVLSLLGE